MIQDEFDDEFEDEFADEFGDVDEAALIEAATQVENQLQFASSSGGLSNEHNFAANLPNFSSHAGISTEKQQQQQWPQFQYPRVNGPLRQTTLTGTPLRENNRPPLASPRQSFNFNNSSQPTMPPNRYRLVEDRDQEPPTHHRIDREAARTWIYPSNMAHRDYQFNIVQSALFNNLLVALPTGLGKTFIAAVVMLNWYRWAPDGHLLFLAPTKPLVEQQIDACYNIAGIPRRDTVELTGRISRKVRAEHWEERRVFFGTPQTIENDLKYGLADPKKIVCVVIDEAHRATGQYAYVKVLEFIRKFNSSFRVLGLTATPGSKVESVQEVIDALGIARVEVRTEESLDIRQYIHQKHVEEVVIELSPELTELKELFAGCMQPFVDELRSKKATFLVDAEKIQLFSLVKSQQAWRATPAAQSLPPPAQGAIKAVFSLLISLAHPFTLLLYHGIRSFYSSFSLVRAELERTKAKAKQRLVSSPKYKELIRRTEELMASPTPCNHPKLDYLVGALLKHFMECEERGETNTKVMVFSSFRVSAEEIVRALKQHEPKIKPHIFVGQADAKDGQAGMNQNEQQRVIKQLKEGVYNTLVATSIGEEGLDIGELDLIMCYDANSSPIRMLQRMGRTGRKREGKIILLLSKGKEEDSNAKAQDNYTTMQKKIISGQHFTYRLELSPRILPTEIIPIVEKKHIIPPVEAPEPVKIRGKKKLPPKKFHMPDGVNTGFIKASRLGKPVINDEEDDRDEEILLVDTEIRSIAPIYDETSTIGLLTSEQQKEHQKRFMTISGDSGDEDREVTIAMPNMDAFPEFQRGLTATKFVGHGRQTKSMVEMMNKMREYEEDPEKIDLLKEKFRKEDLLEESSRDWEIGPEVTLVSPVKTKTLSHQATSKKNNTSTKDIDNKHGDSQGWRFGDISKHKFTPKSKAKSIPSPPPPCSSTKRRRTKSLINFSFEDEEDDEGDEGDHDEEEEGDDPSTGIIEILSSSSSAVAVDDITEVDDNDDDDVVMMDEEGEGYNDSGDDDDDSDDLPDPSSIIKPTPSKSKTQNKPISSTGSYSRGRATRKKRRIEEDSDGDE